MDRTDNRSLEAISKISLTLSLSQEERGLSPFSPWEKGGDEGKRAATLFLR
jgi:hypothetical protein